MRNCHGQDVIARTLTQVWLYFKIRILPEIVAG